MRWLQIGPSWGEARQAGGVRGEEATLTNFGGNQTSTTYRYRPGTEQEVLEILARHSRDSIRAFGSLHSWSAIATGAEVSIDLRRFDAVEPFTRDARNFVRVGAGCRLQDPLLDRLHAATNQTLPTLGAIKRQTVAGAISTGTHGSGRQSLSHFVSRVRLAAYDPANGKPRIFDYDAGDDLKAVRCGLGTMGVILAVELTTVPKYCIVEIVRRHRNLEEILAVCADWPLTQFILMPHDWHWIAFERRICEATDRPTSAPARHLFKIYNLITGDILFHLGVAACAQLGPAWVRGWLRAAPAVMIRNVKRIDFAENILTMGHHYFRHEEMELFVAQSRIADAVQLVRAVIEAFAGTSEPMSPDVANMLRAIELDKELNSLRGSLVHHYPIFFRRILPDDTLVSMASSSDNFTIQSPSSPISRPAAGRHLCDVRVSRPIASQLFAARLHWGKHFPLEYREVAPTYPSIGGSQPLSTH